MTSACGSRLLALDAGEFRAGCADRSPARRRSPSAASSRRVARRLDALLGGGALLARGAHRLERGAGGAVGLVEPRFGGGALVRRRRARGFRFAELRHQRRGAAARTGPARLRALRAPSRRRCGARKSRRYASPPWRAAAPRSARSSAIAREPRGARFELALRDCARTPSPPRDARELPPRRRGRVRVRRRARRPRAAPASPRRRRCGARSPRRARRSRAPSASSSAASFVRVCARWRSATESFSRGESAAARASRTRCARGGLRGGRVAQARRRGAPPALSAPRLRPAPPRPRRRRSPSRFFSTSRRAAGVGASAAAAKPSQRQRSPSRETSRCPGLQPRRQRRARRRGRRRRSARAGARAAAAPGCGRRALRRPREGRDRRRPSRPPSAPARPRRSRRRDRRRAPRRAPFRSRARRRSRRALADICRPAADAEQLFERARLGLQPLRQALGLGERRARARPRRSRASACRSSASSAERFGFRERLHQLFERGGGVLEGRFVGVGAGQRGAIAVQRDEFVLEPAPAPDLLVERAAERVAPRGEIGGGGSARRSAPPRPRPALPRLRPRAPPPRRARRRRSSCAASVSASASSLSPTPRRVGDQRLLALDVAPHLLDAPAQFGGARLRPLLLGRQHVAGGDEPMQRRAGARLGVAQRRQVGGRHRLRAWRFRLAGACARRRRRSGPRCAFCASRVGRLDLAPGDQLRQRLVAADFGAEAPVALALPRLPAQAFDLRIDLLQDVLDAGEVFLGRLQPKLRLVAARMQARRRRPPPPAPAGAPPAWRR